MENAVFCASEMFAKCTSQIINPHEKFYIYCCTGALDKFDI